MCDQVDRYMEANLEVARVNGGYVDQQRGLLILTLTWRYMATMRQCNELSEMFGAQVGAYVGGLVVRGEL